MSPGVMFLRTGISQKALLVPALLAWGVAAWVPETAAQTSAGAPPSEPVVQSSPLSASSAIEQNVTERPEDSPKVRERFMAADVALGAGLAPFAANLYRGLRADLHDASALRNRAALGLASCLLEMNNAEEALKILGSLPPTPSVEIRTAIAHCVLGQKISETEAALAKLDPAKLDIHDRPWLHVARGLARLAGEIEAKPQQPAATAPADASGSAAAAATSEVADVQFLTPDFDAAIALFAELGQPAKAAHARMLRALACIRSGRMPNEAYSRELADGMTAAPSQGTSVQYAKLLAISLAQQNRDAEAVEILRSIRKNPVLPREEKDEAALLAGYIHRPGSAESADALCEVLESGATPDLQHLALERLAATLIPSALESPPPTVSAEAPAVLPLKDDAAVQPAFAVPAPAPSLVTSVYDRLTTFAATLPDTSPILNDVHLVRARLMFGVGNLPRAERASNDLLECFTRSPDKEIAALRILAATAWRANSMRRTADQLARIAARLPNGQERERATLAAADCHYLAATQGENSAGAYAAALAAYTSVQDSLPTPVLRGNILHLRVLCALGIENVRAAVKILDAVTIAPGSTSPPANEATIPPAAEKAAPRAREGKSRTAVLSVDAASLYRGEWVVIEWLRRRNPDEALTRLNRLLAKHPEMRVARPEFHLRFLWQKGLLALAAQDAAEAGKISDEISTVAATLPQESKTAGESVPARREAILGRAALLRQRALASTNLDAVRISARDGIPGEDAVAALLVEARSYAANKAHASARRVFREAWEVSQNRNKSPLLREYAAEAFFGFAREEMVLANNGTPGTSVMEALTAFHNFARQYPESKYVSAALFFQADLFRVANAFGDAEGVYDRLLAMLPDGPARWRAEMGKADCLHARARAKDVSVSADADAPATATASEAVTESAANNLTLAINAYARLYSLPRPLDYKAEAGFKWANALDARTAKDVSAGTVPAANKTDFVPEADIVRWEVAIALLNTPAESGHLGENGRYWVARALMEFAASAKRRGDFARASSAWRYLLDYNKDITNPDEHRLPFITEASRELSALATSPAASPTNSQPPPPSTAPNKDPSSPTPAKGSTPTSPPDEDPIDPPPFPRPS